MILSRARALALIGSSVALARCGSGGPAIRVGSKNFTESIVIAEIYSRALENAGLKVERHLNLGFDGDRDGRDRTRRHRPVSGVHRYRPARGSASSADERPEKNLRHGCGRLCKAIPSHLAPSVADERLAGARYHQGDLQSAQSYDALRALESRAAVSAGDDSRVSRARRRPARTAKVLRRVRFQSRCARTTSR